MGLGPNQDWIILTLGAIAGALITISNLGKIIKEGIANTFNYVKNRRMKSEKVDEMVNSFECIQQKLDSLVAELRPNGGKSLRDIVEKINENTTYNREYVRASLDNDYQMIFETDSVGEYLWVNDTYSRYTGKQDHDLIGVATDAAPQTGYANEAALLQYAEDSEFVFTDPTTEEVIPLETVVSSIWSKLG